MAPRCMMVVLSMIISTLFCVNMMMHAVDAMQYTVGGSQGWTVGTDLQQWASQYTFHVGDDLYFPYPAGQSSVLLVTEEDYNDCNTSEPVTSDGGSGDMLISLMSAETYYFISGHPDQCSQGLRLTLDVQHAAPPPPPPPPTVSAPPPTNNIPSSPVILSPPRSINTPYSTFRPNNSAPPPCINVLTTTLVGVALAIAYICLSA